MSFSQIHVLIEQSHVSHVKIIFFHKESGERFAMQISPYRSYISQNHRFVDWHQFFLSHEHDKEKQKEFNQSMHQFFMDFEFRSFFKFFK